MILEYVKSDLCRYVGPGRLTLRHFITHYFFSPGFKFCFWFRLAHAENVLLKTLGKLQHYRFARKYMLDIPIGTDIGFGLYLGHGKCVVINRTARIGNNVNLSPFTVIGANHGQAATIGDYVYVGPGVCIVEDVIIGNHVKIGAGAVVTKDIVENATSAGVPARVLEVDDEPVIYVQNPWPLDE